MVASVSNGLRSFVVGVDMKSCHLVITLSRHDYLEFEEMREVTYYSAPELGPTWLHQSELAFDGVV